MSMGCVTTPTGSHRPLLAAGGSRQERPTRRRDILFRQNLFYTMHVGWDSPRRIHEVPACQ